MKSVVKLAFMAIAFVNAQGAAPPDLKEAIQTSVASSLGMTAADLKQARQRGTDISALADNVGIDMDVVKDAALQQFLAAAIEDGVMTEEDAKTVSERFNSKQQGRGGGQKGRKGRGKESQKGRGKGGHKGKGGKRPNIEGLHEAVEVAVSTALNEAGLPMSEGMTREQKRTLMKGAEAAGVDFRIIKDAAVKTFVGAGIAAGTITAADGQEFLNGMTEKAAHHQLREKMEDAIQSSVAEALGLSAEEVESKTRRAIQDLATSAEVDLKEIKDNAVSKFVTSAVADGTLTSEEAAKITERNGKGEGRGDKGKRGKKGKKGSRKGKKGEGSKKGKKGEGSKKGGKGRKGKGKREKRGRRG